ncbi:hypothetical protein GJ496_009935 [Pomphorhynchus laevis]|nr:hypothetical protein GJ496_009935 [Pomphorhynchus laevis]
MIFLLYCHDNRIIPKGLRVSKPFSVNLNADPDNCKSKTYGECKKVERECSYQFVSILLKFYGRISNDLRCEEDQSELMILLIRKANECLRIIKRYVDLSELLNLEWHPNRQCYPIRRPKKNRLIQEDSFVNVSDISLTNNQKSALNLGLDFNSCSREFSRYDTLPTIKMLANKCYQNVEDENLKVSCINSLGCEMFKKFEHIPPNFQSKPNISIELKTALKELKNNQNIVIKKADKSKQPVIWAKHDYMSEGNRQFETRIYEKGIKSLLNIAIKNVKDHLERHVSLQSIDKNEFIILSRISI